ncbi:hypothetical protein FKP32DRAFT_532203 [Trametes sanguinea]|nr:hypothetical protein FKP32DRAFT_532203 [Trametes sanguinea]
MDCNLSRPCVSKSCRWKYGLNPLNPRRLERGALRRGLGSRSITPAGDVVQGQEVSDESVVTVILAACELACPEQKLPMQAQKRLEWLDVPMDMAPDARHELESLALRFLQGLHLVLRDSVSTSVKATVHKVTQILNLLLIALTAERASDRSASATCTALSCASTVVIFNYFVIIGKELFCVPGQRLCWSGFHIVLKMHDGQDCESSLGDRPSFKQVIM